MVEPTSEDPPVSIRIRGMSGLQPTPRRREMRRLAAAMRSTIEHLVSTTATTEDLADAADRLEAVAEVFAALPRGSTYQGFAEAANAGAAMREHLDRVTADADGAPDSGDPVGTADGETRAEDAPTSLQLITDHADRDTEFFAFFDHSPLIGLANPLAPPVELAQDRDRVRGTVTFGSAYEGPPGCVHGGFVAAVFDELLGATQSMSGTQGMTAHLGIDYRRPTPLHLPLELEGWLDRRDGRKIWARGRLRAAGEATVLAEAEALFIAFDPGRFRELLEARDPESPGTD